MLSPVTMLAADQRAELTDTAYEQLAADPSARVREETARLPGLPIRILTALAADVDLGRNDVGRVSEYGAVRVPQFMGL